MKRISLISFIFVWALFLNLSAFAQETKEGKHEHAMGKEKRVVATTDADGEG